MLTTTDDEPLFFSALKQAEDGGRSVLRVWIPGEEQAAQLRSTLPSRSVALVALDERAIDEQTDREMTMLAGSHLTIGFE